MMETGILADGSLSPRLKGDIYWKKQKLMFRSEAGGRKSRSHSDILIADLFVKYDEKRANGLEGRLSGDEFLEWPPTATGRDVSLNNISDVMIVRDRLRESGENELLYVILERVIALYFEKNGYEEETRQKIQVSAERREQIEAEYEETVRTYTEALAGTG
ncbi:MAG: hypothetical protein K6B72_13020, partial [Lachnospiraceae bacterium]|nr:hypothetical protein [Lachnospiraceae bacterium]